MMHCLQVDCYYTFTNERNLYIVMEYMVGGDCSSLLKNLGALDENTARIYIAETVAALEDLHQGQGIVHRFESEQLVLTMSIHGSTLPFWILEPEVERMNQHIENNNFNSNR